MMKNERKAFVFSITYISFSLFLIVLQAALNGSISGYMVLGLPLLMYWGFNFIQGSTALFAHTD